MFRTDWHIFWQWGIEKLESWPRCGSSVLQWALCIWPDGGAVRWCKLASPLLRGGRPVYTLARNYSGRFSTSDWSIMVSLYSVKYGITDLPRTKCTVPPSLSLFQLCFRYKNNYHFSRLSAFRSHQRREHDFQFYSTYAKSRRFIFVNSLRG